MKVRNGHIYLYRGDELIDRVFYASPEIRKSIICKWRNLYGQLNRFHFVILPNEITPSKEEQALIYILEQELQTP